MRVLGINAIFHDPAAALVVGGRVVAATRTNDVEGREQFRRIADGPRRTVRGDLRGRLPARTCSSCTT
jgi:predicted NodU family carbamoyl transferase